MHELERHLGRQVISVILLNRKYTKVSRPALEILTHILEVAMLRVWRQIGAACNLTNRTSQNSNLDLLVEELLRFAEPFYWNVMELLEFAKEQPQLSYPSLLEERGLIPSQLKLIPVPKMNVASLLRLDTEETTDSAENPK